MKPKIIFFGNEKLATGVTLERSITLQRLLDDGYEVVAVATRDAGKDTNPVAELAKSRGIPLITPSTKHKLIEALGGYDADLGVLVAFGLILPQGVIDRFPRGILNIHPSLLPIYRGPTPIEQALLDGASETGVTVMKLTEEMDAGPVIGQSTHHLAGDEAKAQLAESLLKKGTDLLVESIEKTGSETPQDSAQAMYTHSITKADGVIDWTKPAIQLEREVRAYAGWPGSRTTLYGREVIVIATHIIVGEPVETEKTESIIQQTGDGWLAIDRLKPTGRREMTAAEFLRGIPPQNRKHPESRI